MIALRQLDIGYRKRSKVKKVFSGIEAEFFAGDLVGLMGDNGAGKSTLLKTITGVLAPLSGEVLISGKSLTTYSSAELAKILSIVTTERVGGFNLRVRDIVASGRIPYINVFGKLGDADVAIINRCMEQMGIVSLAEAFVDELSDGQRQKVMIAKSLAQQTPVIVLDEPTAFLDYKSRQQLFQTLRNLCENERKLILVSSHDLDLMASHITRSVVLETGKGVLII